MDRFFRITLDYDLFNLKRLKEEIKSNNGVATWYLSRKYTPSIYEVFAANNNNNNKIHAFIYCTNMPDQLNRFVLKGEIIGVAKANKTIDGKQYNWKIEIKFEEAYSSNEAHRLVLSHSDRKDEKYGLIKASSPQGTYAEILDKNLINLLQDSSFYDKNGFMSFLNNFVECQCFFDVKGHSINSTGNHKLFIKSNGIQYVEFHHLIFRNFGYDDKKLLSELDSCSDNYIQLCPSCHRAIHYGNYELRKHMLDIILKNKDINKLNELYNKIMTNPKAAQYKSDNLEDFILKIYNLK